jgi:hypothetical protein
MFIILKTTMTTPLKERMMIQFDFRVDLSTLLTNSNIIYSSGKNVTNQSKPNQVAGSTRLQ